MAARLKIAGIIAAAVCLLLTAAAISGPVRSITGLGIGSALVVAMIAALAFGFYIYHAVCQTEFESAELANFKLIQSASTAGAALTILLAAASSILLFHFPFHGLVSVGGGDAGNHVHFISKFINDAPEINQGFSSFYSTAYWLETLFSLNSFQAFRAAFYLEIIILCALFSAVSSSHFRSAEIFNSSRRQFITLAALLAAILVPAHRILLPLVHYLQADGFYPQLFGLIPLLIVWAIYTLVPARPYRWVGLCAVIVWYRYSYGLNLGDLLLTFSILVLWDKLRRFSVSLHDLGAIATAGGAAAAAIYCYGQLLVILPIPGAVAQISIAGAAVGLLLLSASFFFAPGQTDRDDSIFRFPAVFSLINGFVPLLLLFNSEHPTYYLFKYSFHGVVLAVLANVLLCSVLICRIIWQPDRNKPIGNLRAGAILACSFCGLWLLNSAYRPLRPSYLDRISGKISSDLIYPLSDEGARREIELVLRQENRKFGGLITPSWPISNFLNSSFGYYGALGLYRHGIIKPDPGYCVFFENGPEALKQYDKLKLEKVLGQISNLISAPGAESKNYKNLETGIDETLTHVCFN